MNSRELSEKLDVLAFELEDPDVSRETLDYIAKELRQLSNEKYAPGNGLSWSDVKPKPVNKTFTDPSGRKLPF